MTRVPRPAAVLRLIRAHRDDGRSTSTRTAATGPPNAPKGTAVRYVCGHTTGELADRIDAAEQERAGG